MRKNEAETHLVSARIDRDTVDRFEHMARQNDRSVSAELRIAIRERLERNTVPFLREAQIEREAVTLERRG